MAKKNYSVYCQTLYRGLKCLNYEKTKIRYQLRVFEAHSRPINTLSKTLFCPPLRMILIFNKVLKNTRGDLKRLSAIFIDFMMHEFRSKKSLLFLLLLLEHMNYFGQTKRSQMVMDGDELY